MAQQLVGAGVEGDVARSYGDKGKNGVLKIYPTTQPEAITYFIDGQPATKTDFNRLSPDSIKEIKVPKRGTAATLKASPKSGEINDIYLITTKQH